MSKTTLKNPALRQEAPVCCYCDAALSCAQCGREQPGDGTALLTFDAACKRIETLEAALDQSVRLQSHYAELLNMHDGGQRITFADAKAWIDRLAALAPEQKR